VLTYAKLIPHPLSLWGMAGDKSLGGRQGGSGKYQPPASDSSTHDVSIVHSVNPIVIDILHTASLERGSKPKSSSFWFLMWSKRKAILG